MRTSEVAAQARVNPQTLRYYERRGLLPEPERSASGYRAYGPQAVRLVRVIKRAQDLGFTLDDVESLLHLADGGPESCDAARELATAKIADLDGRGDSALQLSPAVLDPGSGLLTPDSLEATGWIMTVNGAAPNDEVLPPALPEVCPSCDQEGFNRDLDVFWRGTRRELGAAVVISSDLFEVDRLPLTVLRGMQ